MLPVIVYLIIMVAMMLLADLTRPVPKAPKRPGLGDFDFPTADASRKVPVVWGKPLIAGPNVTWYGDLSIGKITKKIKGTFVSKKQTVGYKYYVGMHMAMCVASTSTSSPVRLLKIRIGDEVAWEGNSAGGQIAIGRPDLFGGEESEGGIEGFLDWCPGGPDQPQNDYLARAISNRVPAYRSSARIVWRGGYVGTSKYIKEWAIQVQRLPNLLGTGYHDINGEANAAEMIYEMLVTKIWGLGVSNLDINLDSFQRSAKTLHGEGFGLSLTWDGSKALRDVATDILAHVDGLLFVDVQTGKWQFELNREQTQAQLDALPVFNQDNIQDLENYSRPTLDEVTNEVNVVWTQDGETTKWPAQAQHLGLFQVHDKQFVSVEIAYPGITSYALAQRVASRELRQQSYPLVKVSFKANRSAWQLKPGSRFNFSWEPLGVDRITCMVVGIDYGTIDDNIISVDAVQDIFALGTALYVGNGSSQWTEPSRDPQPVNDFKMMFSPYWALASSEDVPSPEAAVPMLLVRSPGRTQMSFEIRYNDPSQGDVFTAAEEPQPFTPTGVLANDYLESDPADTSRSFVVRDFDGSAPVTGTDAELRQLGTGLILVDEEWMGVVGFSRDSAGNYVAAKVYRGLLDSTPTRHLAGAIVWFVSMGAGRTPTQLVPFAAGYYRARMMTRAITGVLPIERAPLAEIYTNARDTNARPLYDYPPRFLVINGSSTPTLVSGKITASWLHSNKVAEGTQVFNQGDSSNKPSGTTYTAALFDDNGNQIEVQTGITGAQVAFAANPPERGYVQVWTVNAVGRSQAATLWFGVAVDYSATDADPQRFLDEAGPISLLRMAD